MKVLHAKGKHVFCPTSPPSPRILIICFQFVAFMLEHCRTALPQIRLAYNMIFFHDKMSDISCECKECFKNVKWLGDLKVFLASWSAQLKLTNTAGTHTTMLRPECMNTPADHAYSQYHRTAQACHSWCSQSSQGNAHPVAALFCQAVECDPPHHCGPGRSVQPTLSHHLGAAPHVGHT